MPFNCFRQPSAQGEELPTAPRPIKYERLKTATFRRTPTSGSISSAASKCSNTSIPPCKRNSDPKIEAMMMALPHEPRPSRCLRMSHPKIYGNIIDSMKSERGCRDWRSFATFHADEVDMKVSAIEAAEKRARDFERRMRELESFSSASGSDQSSEVDMIG